MNANQNNFSEQERANRLAEALDRLMNGEPPNSTDSLLAVAQNLLSAPLEPSTAALARFDQQLNRWFHPPVPRTLPRSVPRFPLIAAGLGLAVVLIAAGIAFRLTVYTPPPMSPTVSTAPTLTSTSTATSSFTPTATPTLTMTPSFTPTVTATLLGSSTTISTATPTPPVTATLTESATETFTPTPLASLAFAQVVINGTIDSIQGAIISILGQSVVVQGGAGGLCIGDWVSFTARMLPNGMLQVERTVITVISSGCGVTRVPPAVPTPSGSGDDDHHNGHNG